MSSKKKRWSKYGGCYPRSISAPDMQRDERCGILKRRRAALSVALVPRNYEWTLNCKLVVAIEICRIREQLQLQNAARCRVWASAFNINALSDRECLTRYRFKRQDVGFISDLIPWETSLDPQGKMRTMRRRYRVDPVEATAIFLRRLATPSRWVDLQQEFGKHTAALSELFYHALELFYTKFGSTLRNWPENLISLRAANYVRCVFEK
jgi:hypothetical protein